LDIGEESEERTVDVPDDLMNLMETEPEVMAFYSRLSFTQKKEYVGWITEAKMDETRKARFVKAVEMIKRGVKTPDQ